jgi:membrane-associated phospholipid phosphatase
MHSLLEIDRALFLAVYGSETAAWLPAARALSWLGGGAGIPIALLAPRFRKRSGAMVFGGALLVNAAIVWALKLVIARPRPFLSTWPNVEVHALTLPAPRDYACPSGHAAGAFCFAVLLLQAHKRTYAPYINIILLTAAFGVAWSRIYLGVHHPFDVTLGGLIGAAVGALGRRAIHQTEQGKPERATS